MKHYDDDQLQAHLADPDPAVARHVDSCRPCRETLAFLRRFDEALRDPQSWALAEELETGPFTPPPALRERAASIDAERKRVAALLEPVLVSLVAFQEADLEHDRKFHAEEVVRQLSDEAYDLRQREPKFALRLVESALAIAGKVRVGGQLLGAAQLELGTVLFVLGRYQESERAFARAEQAYAADSSTTGWDHARLLLNRASLYVETERLEEASELASRAAEMFREFGDRERERSALMIRGSVLQVVEDWTGALSVYETILQAADRDQDLHAAARAAHNAGNCHDGLGEYYKATEYYAMAATYWDELGEDVEATRVAWSLGKVFLALGRLDQGIEQLREARARFELLGVVNDEALVRLHLAEALLLAERPTDVPELLQGITVSFVAEGMMRNARIALTYLDEAVRMGKLTAAKLKHVRHYLEELPMRPRAQFAPPAA